MKRLASSSWIMAAASSRSPRYSPPSQRETTTKNDDYSSLHCSLCHARLRCDLAVLDDSVENGDDIRSISWTMALIDEKEILNTSDPKWRRRRLLFFARDVLNERKMVPRSLADALYSVITTSNSYLSKRCALYYEDAQSTTTNNKLRIDRPRVLLFLDQSDMPFLSRDLQRRVHKAHDRCENGTTELLVSLRRSRVSQFVTLYNIVTEFNSLRQVADHETLAVQLFNCQSTAHVREYIYIGDRNCSTGHIRRVYDESVRARMAAATSVLHDDDAAPRKVDTVNGGTIIRDIDRTGVLNPWWVKCTLDSVEQYGTTVTSMRLIEASRFTLFEMLPMVAIFKEDFESMRSHHYALNRCPTGETCPWHK